MQVCGCMCGHVGSLTTHCGIPSCLHPQINKAGSKSLRWRERERETFTFFVFTNFMQLRHRQCGQKGFERKCVLMVRETLRVTLKRIKQ